MFDPDFCEDHCPVCTRARAGNRFARILQSVEMVVTFGGCPWGRARQREYGVKPSDPLPLAQTSPMWQCGSADSKATIALSIAPELKAEVSKVAVACVTAAVKVTAHNEALWREIEAAAARYRGMMMDEVRKFSPIRALRDAYRALGADPTRYRGSNEALARRITQGKELCRTNTVVDVSNLISLESSHSGGVFDLNRIRPPITFRIGQPGESYLSIGRGEIKIEGLPVFADQRGPFGSTTSDSQRTMVRLKTTGILMVVTSFLGNKEMNRVLERMAELLERYAAATDVRTSVIE